MDREETFQSTFESAADKRRRADHDDLQNEMAGRETGRLKRFIFGRAAGGEASSKESKDLLKTLEWLIANNAVYAAYYQQTLDLLGHAERETENALREAQEAFDGLMARAVRLSDGRAVFLDENGNVVTEDGKTVDPELAESIEWPTNAPTYEEYRGAKGRINDLQDYQTGVLGEARRKLNNNKQPQSMDEMEQIQRDIRSGLDNVVHKAGAEKPNAEAPRTLGAEVGLPDLGV